MPSVRRTHAKSRNGCANCKQTRVKCDEARPKCGRCAERRLPCQFIPATPRRAAVPSEYRSASPHSSVFGSTDDLPSRGDELELFHHFVTRTSNSCDNHTRPPEFWKETLPILATKHHYLLHAILSFTCLHVAHLRPVEAAKYREFALIYRDRTLAELPSVFSDPRPEQTEACFWASSFVGLVALAQYNTPENVEHLPRSACLIELSRLWKGAETVALVCAQTTGVDEHNDVLQSPSSLPDLSSIADDDELYNRLDMLGECIRSRSTPTSSVMCTDAVHKMKEAYVDWSTTGSSRKILSWIPCVRVELLEHVQRAETVPCLILTYYGTLVHLIRHVWYVQDMGSRIVQEMSGAVLLSDREVVSLVNWARQRVCS